MNTSVSDVLSESESDTCFRRALLTRAVPIICVSPKVDRRLRRRSMATQKNCFSSATAKKLSSEFATERVDFAGATRYHERCLAAASV